MRENPAGESKNTGLKLLFDRRLRLEFRGAKITTDAGLLAVRELEEMMGLTEMAADLIVERRTGKNVQHQIPGLLRQSVYARLAGYEDVNDHEGLSRDPAMRAVIGTYKSQSQGNISPYATLWWFSFVYVSLWRTPRLSTSIGSLTSPRILRTFQNLRTPLMVFAPRHLSEVRKPLFVKSRRLWLHRGLLGLGAYPRGDPHAQRTRGICLC